MSDELMFSSAEAAKAAGMTPTNFRAYLARGLWNIPANAVAAETLGKGHRFTILHCLGFALAFELVNCGVEPAQALKLAMGRFALVSSDTGRAPGGVFDPLTRGPTFFVCWPDANLARCVGANDFTRLEHLLQPNDQARESRCVIIVLNDLRDRVFATLGLDSRDHEG